MPKVSIIIPIYNVEKYLRECLDSVINQTLHDIEIICVNDGSTDDSLSILEEYSSHDNRLILINKQNGGTSSARNFGIKNAYGEYLYFLDSDDYIDVRAMEILYHISVENDLDVLYFDGQAFFENKLLENNFPSYKQYYKRNTAYDKLINGQLLFAQMNKNKEYLPSLCLQFLKASYLKDIKLRFYEGIIHEDNLFTFLCIMQAKRVSHINMPLFYRRVRENSTMTQLKRADNVKVYLICFIETLKFLNEYDYSLDIKNEIESHVNQLLKNGKQIFRMLDMNDRSVLKWDDLYTQVMFDNFIEKSEYDRTQIEHKENEIKKYKEELTQNKKRLEENRIESTKILIRIEKYEAELIQNKKQLEENRIEFVNMMTQIERYREKLDQEKKQVEQYKIELKNRKMELIRKNDVINTLKNSKSFKIGRIITFIPRIIKNIFI